MESNDLKQTITAAASDFTMEIVNILKSATLQELTALQQKPVSAKRGSKPGSKRISSAAAGSVQKKTRLVKNYPKCAYPDCENNRFIRGKGFCGEHWRLWKEGKIEDASHYKK